MSPRTILFVCTGNTCRSPMAEAMARELIAQGLLGSSNQWVVRSAGLWAGQGRTATDAAARAANAQGADLSGHRSKALTPELVEWASLILGMTQEHVDAILRNFPKASDRVWRLDETDIIDPYGGDQQQYDRTAEQIRRALRRRLPEIAGVTS